MLHTRIAVKTDIPFLADRLRKADREEVKASGGLSPRAALQRGWAHSEIARTIRTDNSGKPVAIYGVVRIDQELPSGGVWLLGTDDLTSYGMPFARRCGEHIEMLQESYPVLFNYVDARNSLHIRWLKWSGFRFIRRHECFGHEKRPFYEFIRVR